MKKLIKNYIKKWGYTPTIYELHTLYCQGALSLNAMQENELLAEFEKVDGLY